MSIDNEPLVLNVTTVAKLLSISRNSCYEAIRMGQIPSLRFGRRIVIPKAALDRLLNGQNQDGKGGQETIPMRDKKD